MEVIFILIFISISVALAFILAFFWAVKSGQFDDTYSPGQRILFDNPSNKSKSKNKTPKS